MDNKYGKLGNDASKALQAHQTTKEAEKAQKTITGDDVTSLNKLLQWSAANSSDKAAAEKAKDIYQSKTEAEKKQETEWLDTAFPDMNAGIRWLVTQLEDGNKTAEEQVQILQDLQEYFLDLNYAINIEKLGVLQPVLERVSHEDAQVRANSIWILGTAMQQLPQVKDIMMEHRAHELITQHLSDEEATVHAKSVMAASALLNHSSEVVQDVFKSIGGTKALRKCLSDDHVQTRRRARFFLQFAQTSGNEAFVNDVLQDKIAVTEFSSSLGEVDGDDIADVEAAIGALSVLVDKDSAALLRVSPELPGVLDALAARCTDEETSAQVTNLAAKMA